MSREPSAAAIAVMAKAPRAGRVKTRLTPLLSPADAESLSASFIADITETIHEAAKTTSITPFIAYAPAGSEHRFAGIIAPGTGLVLADGESIAESGIRGIGRSLLQAARSLMGAGFATVCLVSADSPSLPAELLCEATRLLARPGDRVVLGPADDGGYYLIGLKTPHARLFQDITWSADTVAQETCARAAELGIEVARLRSWYDVDDEATLRRIARALASGRERAPATRRCLLDLGLIDEAHS